MDLFKEKIEQIIREGNMREARDLILELDFLKLDELLAKIGFDNRDMIQLYFLVLDMLGERDEVEIHRLALSLLSMPLCIIPGAYFGAIYHLKKIIDLEPDSVNDKEYLLSFYTNPNRLISDVEAEGLVKEVLRAKPNSTIAIEILKILNKIH